jgi:hypothetical protein
VEIRNAAHECARIVAGSHAGSDGQQT